MKGWKRLFHANSNQKRTGVAILTLDKIDFKSRLQETQTLYINKNSIEQEDIAIINIYTLTSPKYMKQNQQN